VGDVWLGKDLNASDLEASLLDVVRPWTSQINGCAHCADMQSKDLRARGESEQRFYLGIVIAQLSLRETKWNARSFF
jgi:AhpD family alkylhydroperoxidase